MNVTRKCSGTYYDPARSWSGSCERKRSRRVGTGLLIHGMTSLSQRMGSAHSFILEMRAAKSGSAEDYKRQLETFLRRHLPIATRYVPA